MSIKYTYRTMEQVRGAVKRHLADAAESGTDALVGDLSDVLFNTDLHLAEASAAAITDGGDTFVAELSTLVADYQGEPDKLAFLVALAVYTR